MMIIKNKQIKFKIIISSLGILYFLGLGFTNASLDRLSINLDNYIISKVDTKKSDKETFENFLSKFCSETTIELSEYEGYKPEHSVFLFLLCKDTHSKDFKIKQGTGEYISNFSLPDIYKNTENYIQKAFDKVISSYTSIYQARIYGYVSKDTKAAEEANYFAQTNFNFGSDFLDICATDKSYSYPKTCKTLKSYIKGAKSLINSKNNILNNDLIYSDFNKNKKNIISDGLYSNIFEDFISLIYNEIFFYGLFIEYYTHTLQEYSFFKNRGVTNFDKQISNNKKRIENIFNNFKNSHKAIDETLQVLSEMYYSFPIHIGFLLYKEDIHRFNGAIVKLLTPIDVLQYTLINVQEK